MTGYNCFHIKCTIIVSKMRKEIKMHIINLDHFVITVHDLQKSVYFYHNIIGLPISEKQTNENFASLKCGNSLLRIRKESNDVGAIVAHHLITGSFDFCLETNSTPNEIIQSLKNHQIDVELGPVTKHGFKGVMTSIYVRDPDKNLVEISTYKK